jgi:hypothetical protein
LPQSNNLPSISMAWIWINSCDPLLLQMSSSNLSSVPEILQLHQSVGTWCLQLSIFCGTQVNWWSCITCHIPLLCDIKTCAGLLRVIFSCRNLEVWESSCIQVEVCWVRLEPCF